MGGGGVEYEGSECWINIRVSTGLNFRTFSWLFLTFYKIKIFVSKQSKLLMSFNVFLRYLFTKHYHGWNEKMWTIGGPLKRKLKCFTTHNWILKLLRAFVICNSLYKMMLFQLDNYTKGLSIFTQNTDA